MTKPASHTDDDCIAHLTDVFGAAEMLGVTCTRVRQLDDALRPAMLGGRVRVYSRQRLARYVTYRDATRDAAERQRVRARTRRVADRRVAR